jgi:hypothetical protein
MSQAFELADRLGRRSLHSEVFEPRRMCLLRRQKCCGTGKGVREHHEFCTMFFDVFGIDICEEDH